MTAASGQSGATSFPLGASDRRMEKLVAQLGIGRLSKSQGMAKELDVHAESLPPMR